MKTTMTTIREDYCKAYKSILPTLANFSSLIEIRRIAEKQRNTYKELAETLETAEFRRNCRTIANIMGDIAAETYYCESIPELILKCSISIAYNDISNKEAN